MDNTIEKLRTKISNNNFEYETASEERKLEILAENKILNIKLLRLIEKSNEKDVKRGR